MSKAKGASVPFLFSFEEKQLRIIVINGEPWFVAADVCAALEIGNPSMALRALDDDEKALSSIEGLSRGNDQANIINESGLYSLILRSRKPEAKRFKKWVTSEVLPAIRKTGRYEAQQSKYSNARLEIEVRTEGEGQSYYCIKGVNKENAAALLSAIAIVSYEIAEIAQRDTPAYFPKQFSKTEASITLGNPAFGRFAA